MQQWWIDDASNFCKMMIEMFWLLWVFQFWWFSFIVETSQNSLEMFSLINTELKKDDDREFSDDLITVGEFIQLHWTWNSIYMYRWTNFKVKYSISVWLIVSCFLVIKTCANVNKSSTWKLFFRGKFAPIKMVDEKKGFTMATVWVQRTEFELNSQTLILN